ncbi:MAG: ArsR family transcriptional regulator [Bacteroidetes bacterium]|nr:MAG: ArsR family transcriptional regulator [Bacteroidota bacterium]
MLESLITSKTRIKLLLKFFLNSSNTAYLRGLEPEFGESTNAIRHELNRFEKADLLTSKLEGNKKLYQANTNHPLFPEIHKLLIKHIGLDKVIEKVIKNLGQVKEIYLVGELAKGKNSKVIDLWFIGKDLDRSYLMSLIEKAEALIKRKIRYIVLDNKELQDFLKNKRTDELLLVWKSE